MGTLVTMLNCAWNTWYISERDIFPQTLPTVDTKSCDVYTDDNMDDASPLAGLLDLAQQMGLSLSTVDHCTKTGTRDMD